MPVVSTIIPAYNAARFIREAVNSALAQEGVEQEVIVVDDGSTDETLEILKTYGSRIRVVQQANGGPAKARNHGARLAQGEWLAFLDADDIWMPGKLAAQVAIATDRTMFVYTDRSNVGETEGIGERVSDRLTLPDGDIFEALLVHGNFVTLSSAIVRRSVFEAHGGFDESSDFIGVEDWDLWLRLARAGEVRCCPQSLVNYRWHSGGISRRLDHMNRAQRLVVERACRDNRALRRKAMFCSLSVSASFAGLSRSWAKAAQWYLQAAWYSPLSVAPYKGLVKCMLRRI